MFIMNTLKSKTIRFTTAKLPASVLKPGVTLYRAMVANTGTKKIKEIAEDMAKMGCDSKPATISYVLQFFADNLPDMIASDGCRRSLGELVTLYPAIGGTFTTPDGDADEAANPVVLRATTPKATRLSLSGVTLYNVTNPAVSPALTSEFDISTDKQDTLVVGSAARLVGVDLLLVPGRADEGVWLSNADGTINLQMTVTVPKTKTIDITTPAGKTATDIPAGAYTLTVKTRAGRAAEMQLYTLTRAVTVSAL
jgi:hypothetical protein